MVQLPLPGELLYFCDEGRGAVGARKSVGEICIPGDWQHDWTSFDAGLPEGALGGKRLRIERL